MNSAECKRYSRLLDPYYDGALEASAAADVEAHVAECEHCQEHLQLYRATAASLRAATQTQTPDGLRARLATAMAAEKAREDVRARASSRASASLSWRLGIPMAAAAGLLLFAGFRSHTADALASAALANDLLSDLVSEHSHPLPPEATDMRSLRAFERYIGVPVRPANFERAGARLVGGRVMPLHSQRAAMLQYEMGSGDDIRRVSVLVYDPQKVQIGDSRLAPRAAGTSQVRVGSEKGYSVAITERDGVGYAITSDLDLDKSAQLAKYVYDE